MPRENHETQPAEGVCTVCGKDVTGITCTARLYRDGRPFALCCPMCLDLFQRAPERFARGEKPQRIVEDLFDQIRWRERGS